MVVSRQDLSPRLMILRVAPDGWTFPEFLPGQYTTLGLPGSAPGKLVRRAYSIASPATARETLDFYLNLIPEGVLSPRLFALREGDRLWLSPRAVGRFTLEQLPPGADVVFVGNGTGLAPYVSMLRTRPELADQRRVVLIHGVRCSADLGYRGFFEDLQRRRPRFAYLPVISRPQLEPGPWHGAVGHVQDVWRTLPHEARTHVYLCGSPLMIASMTAIVAGQGFAIHTEGYWTPPR